MMLARNEIESFILDRSASTLSKNDQQILAAIHGFTMTSIERQLALIRSVRYLVRNQIEGCVVECGVWRGGSCMASALTLLQEGDPARTIYLYDTFNGMSPPTVADYAFDGTSAEAHLECDPERQGNVWAVADLDDVKRNLRSTGYPHNQVKYVEGRVEETLPKNLPEEPLALLRLDTDWYESTSCELQHLFPRLIDGGILIVDDYGHWCGAKQAVDEYFMLDRTIQLHCIDYTGVLLVKSNCAFGSGAHV